MSGVLLALLIAATGCSSIEVETQPPDGSAADETAAESDGQQTPEAATAAAPADPEDFPVQTAVVDATSFLEGFDGAPEGPTPWDSADWDVTVHSRDWDTWENLEPMEKAHGPGCEPPPARHTGTAYEEAVYNCKDHVMTALNAVGYAMVYLTPNQLVDFSEGEAVIRFDVSTKRFSARDWIDIWVTPYDQNIQLVLHPSIPDGNGTPADGLQIEMVENIDISSTRFDLSVFDSGVETRVDGAYGGYEDVLEPDEKRRDTFELRISKDYVRFGMPDYDLWWIDMPIDELGWDRGVVQLGHHSYNPFKACDDDGTCAPGTWHWDNVEISPATPFTMLQSDTRAVGDIYGTDGEGVINFSGAAPADAHLRFAAFGEDIEVSYDGGSTWEPAAIQAQTLDPDGGVFISYWTPVPEGTQQVHIRGKAAAIGPFHARDFTIWAP